MRTVPVQTNVTEAEGDVGDGDGRPSADEHTSVDTLRHVDFDIDLARHRPCQHDIGS